MFTQRRSCSSHPFLFVLGFMFLMLAPAVGAVVSAQSLPIQAQPAPTPTERFDPPLQIEPSPTPDREPQLRVDPTAVPLEPTAELPVVIAGPGALTVNKGVCDDTNFDPFTASGIEAFEEACFSPDGEFEFTVSDGGAFSETAMTSLGSVAFDVPVGAITITETIPEGFGDPAVFCWSDLLPTPSDIPFIGNGPIWDVSEGEQVECWWFNTTVSAGGHDFFLNKYECPADFDTASDWFTFSTTCTTPMNGVGFNVTDGQGPIFQETETGNAEWPNIDFGDGDDLVITESIPDGYGEPVAFCTILLAGAADPEDFDTQLMEVIDGVVTASPVLGEQDHFHCAFFNILDGGAPGDLVEPGSLEDGSGNVVTLIKRQCPMGVVEDAEFEDYQEICTQEHDDIEFTLSHAGGSFPGTTADGQLQWTDVPSGDFEIQETVLAGFLDPLVWCGFTPTIFAPELTPSTGGLVNGSFEDDESEYVCYWFNIQVPDANNTIRITAYLCPAGTPYVNDTDYYLANCTDDNHEGVEFTLSAPHGEFPETTAGDGIVEWAAIPLGESSIQQTFEPGFGDPVVLCNFATTVPHGLPFEDGPPLRLQSPGGLILTPINEPGVEYRCSWFNIPLDGSSLLIEKRNCPEDFDPENDIPSVVCADPINNVTFTAQDLDPASPDLTATTGNGIFGSAHFAGIPPEFYTVTETLPDGIAYGFVGGCLRNGEEVALLIVEPDRLDIMIEENEFWQCDWYNVEGDDNSVSVRKLECPEGTSPDEDQDWYEANCTETVDGVEFTLTSYLGDEVGETAGGVVGFDDLPVGVIEIQETIPIGFGNPVVFCRTDGDWSPYPAPGGTIGHDFPDLGETLFCHWFNVPAEPGYIVINKWVCPEGATYDHDDGWYYDNCTETLDGTTFAVTSESGMESKETVDGEVEFQGLPIASGVFGIQETIPDEYGEPIVFCWEQRLDAPTGYISYDHEFAENVIQILSCAWFNIPGEPGSVTLLKWTCPAGYDLHAGGADPKLDCTEATDGIEFQFGLDIGLEAEAELQTTGDLIPGGVFFDGLEPDSYKAVELVPEGIDHVFVLECTGHIMGVLQPYPLEIGNVLEMDVDAGEHLTCHIYNVPESPGGRITVTKHRCSTEIFVSEVDCQVFEDGKTFDLLHWNIGDGVWEAIDTQVTDGVGQIVWNELEPGDFGLDEHDGEWRHLTTIPVFGEGDYFYVYENEETAVSVYNCDGESGEPGETPEKYPNTGTPPDGRDDNRLQP